MTTRPPHPPQPDRPLTLDEVLEAAGPGWGAIIREVWRTAHARGWAITGCKEKHGRLDLRVAARRTGVIPAATLIDIGRALGVAEERSAATCEACGALGMSWDDVEHHSPAPLDGVPHACWTKTLCASCAWRFYAEGKRDWASIAGRWRSR